MHVGKSSTYHQDCHISLPEFPPPNFSTHASVERNYQLIVSDKMTLCHGVWRVYFIFLWTQCLSALVPHSRNPTHSFVQSKRSLRPVSGGFNLFCKADLFSWPCTWILFISEENIDKKLTCFERVYGVEFVTSTLCAEAGHLEFELSNPLVDDILIYFRLWFTICFYISLC